MRGRATRPPNRHVVLYGDKVYDFFQKLGERLERFGGWRMPLFLFCLVMLMHHYAVSNVYPTHESTVVVGHVLTADEIKTLGLKSPQAEAADLDKRVALASMLSPEPMAATLIQTYWLKLPIRVPGQDSLVYLPVRRQSAHDLMGQTVKLRKESTVLRGKVLAVSYEFLQ
jgi:hypothetical protein